MDDKSSIPLHIVYLFIGYFHHTLTEAEHQELDDWVCESIGNQHIFEHCVKLSMAPFLPDRYEEEEKEKDDKLAAMRYIYACVFQCRAFYYKNLI